MARLIAAVFIALLSLGFPTSAHMPDRPDLDKWFAKLSSKGGGLCCSFIDGEAIADVDWDTACDMPDCHYRVRLNGEWIRVPDNVVVQEPNRYGPAIVWPIFKYNSKEVQQIRCFMPGAGT